jgi:hypothetical protein
MWVFISAILNLNLLRKEKRRLKNLSGVLSGIPPKSATLAAAPLRSSVRLGGYPCHPTGLLGRLFSSAQLRIAATSRYIMVKNIQIDYGKGMPTIFGKTIWIFFVEPVFFQIENSCIHIVHYTQRGL